MRIVLNTVILGFNSIMWIALNTVILGALLEV